MEFKYARFDNDFFSEEIRDEYLVSSKMKKVWAVEIDLLMKLLDVCNKYEIRVYAFAGTLLGAVRHQGFIPWDDDIDLCILQDDFIKLEKIAKEAFEEPYFLQTALTDKRYFFGYARLRNSNTTGVISWNDSPEYNNGIYIDIFVLNGIPRDGVKLKRLLKRRDWTHKLLNTYYKSYPKKGIKRVGQSLLSFILQNGYDYETIVNNYRNTLSSYDKSADRLALLTHDWDYIHRYWCPIYSFESTVELPFENIKIPAPSNYKEILSNTYGDYMDFPSIEKRGKWHDEMIVFDPDISYKEYYHNKEIFK